MSYFNNDKNTKSRGAGAIAAVDLGKGGRISSDKRVAQPWNSNGPRLASRGGRYVANRYGIGAIDRAGDVEGGSSTGGKVIVKPTWKGTTAVVVKTPRTPTSRPTNVPIKQPIQTKYTSTPVKPTPSTTSTTTTDSGTAYTAGTFTGGGGGGGGGSPGLQELTPDEIDELDPAPESNLTSRLNKKNIIIGAVALAGIYYLLRKKRHS